MNNKLLLSLLTLVLATTCTVTFAEPQYSGMIVERDVMVPMRDGVRLAADVYRPALGSQAETQALPIILHCTPYNKYQDDTWDNALFFVQHGYVVGGISRCTWTL